MSFVNTFLADSLRPGWVTASFPVIRIVLLALMVLTGLVLIATVLFQQGNSDGLGAISGQTDTFFGKNKGKTLDGKLKKLTIVCGILILTFSILFFITVVIFPAA